MPKLYVRLKPYDPRRGFVLKRYTYRGIKFHEERGWYQVDRRVGDYLKTVRQVGGDEHAPPAFDVLTEAEAKALDAEEDKKKTERKKAAQAPVVTTKDLPEEDKATSTGKGKKRGK